MIKKVILYFNYLVFLVEIPYIFSPDLKKLSFFYSALLSVLVCFRFVSTVGLKNQKRWGMEGLALASATIVFLMFMIPYKGILFNIEIFMAILNILFGFYYYRFLQSGL